MNPKFFIRTLPSLKRLEDFRVFARRLCFITNHLLCNSLPNTKTDTQLMAKTHQNLPCLQGKLLIVEGNIAAGKSIFSKRLGKYFDFVVHDEPAPKNPYLAKFYKEPKKYALKLQLWLFQQRFLMYVQSLKHIMNTGQGVILDRSVYSDLVFTNVIYKNGNISEDGYEYYLQVRERAMEHLQTPYAVIHLHTPPKICYERIVERGREYEQRIPLSYLSDLEREHQIVFDNLSKAFVCPVLTYDWSEYGRSSNCEEMAYNPNEDIQFYASGFNKIVSDLRSIKSIWKPTIADVFLQCDSKPDILDTIFSVEGYEHISHEIPD